MSQLVDKIELDIRLEGAKNVAEASGVQSNDANGDFNVSMNL